MCEGIISEVTKIIPEPHGSEIRSLHTYIIVSNCVFSMLSVQSSACRWLLSNFISDGGLQLVG